MKRASRVLAVGLAVAASFSLVCQVSVAADSSAKRIPTLVFERGNSIWIAGPDWTKPEKGARKLATGADPAVSPDGRQVAFTRDTSSAKDVRRSIAIFDLETKTTRGLDQIRGGNTYGPDWSPDGKRLLVSAYLVDAWSVAIVDVDASREFRIVARGGGGNGDCWTPTWAPDGNSFWCHDLEALRHFSFEGKEVARISLVAKIPGGGLNSGARLSFSPDGASLLVDVDMDEAGERPGWDGPPPAIFHVELASEKVERVSPPGAFAWLGTWLPGGDVLCTCLLEKEKETSLCRLPAGGEPMVRVIRRARQGSIGRPPVAGAKGSGG